MKIDLNSLNVQYKQETEALEEKMGQAADLIESVANNMINQTTLQGQTYDSIRTYYENVEVPILQGVACACESKNSANTEYIALANKCFDQNPVFCLEETKEKYKQVKILRRILQDNLILSKMSADLINQLIELENILLESIDKALTFLSESADIYSSYETILSAVQDGVREEGKVIRTTGGSIDISDINTDWAVTVATYYEISDAEYEKMAKETYPQLFVNDDSMLSTVVEVMKYERFHPANADIADKFLSPVDLGDQMYIKAIAYSSPEPYRSVWFTYIQDFDITSTTVSGVFTRPTGDKNGRGTLEFDLANDRTNPRGAYYTFFHECGHAVDYYYGVNNGYDSFYSASFTDSNGNTLSESNIEDVRNNVESVIDDIYNEPFYSNWTDAQKNEAKKAVTHNIMNQDNDYATLTKEEQALQRAVENYYSSHLSGPTNNVPSDMYSGVTNFTISGSYSHASVKDSKGTYWFYNDGTTRRTTNAECFAEYYSYAMLQSNNGNNAMQTYMPESKETINELVESMVK